MCIGSRLGIEGALERTGVVHLETWALEAVAAAGGVDVPLPMGPFPERALRPLLSDTTALDRLEAARDAVAAATRADVPAALDALDRVFEELTGRPAARGDGDSGGGRTVAYLDCMRDLDVTLGGAVLDELRASLPRVLTASRWWCGRVFDRGAGLLGELARPGPLAPMLGELMGAGFGLWNQMAAEQRELQSRWAAGDAFADWTPARRFSTYHSADPRAASSRAHRSSASRATWTSRAHRSCGRCGASSRLRGTTPWRAVEFTEMLPGPEDCWLRSDAGRHTSELRVVAVGRRRARSALMLAGPRHGGEEQRAAAHDGQGDDVLDGLHASSVPGAT
jgi:hypothetical protein